MDNETEKSQEVAQEQHKKQYDWLRGYQFVKGQSGNPGGRPKGSKSLKQFAKEYLESLPDEEKIEFLKTLSSELVFRMAEGNPHQSNDTTVEVKPSPLLNAIRSNNSNQQDSEPKEESTSDTGGNISG